jgi:AcrR family transcriptional regulator
VPARSLSPTSAEVPRAQVTEIQRSRLLAATVRAVDELGYEAVTVAQITARARISRRTFYELFANREECLAAVLAHAVQTAERDLDLMSLAGLTWPERMRVGLWRALAFLEREPVLARVCIMQALRGAGAIQRQREEILARLARAVDKGRAEDCPATQISELTAEGLVGAVFAMVHSRLTHGQRRRSGPGLCELHGELLGMILLPYLGATATRREQARPAPESPQSTSHRPLQVARAGDPLEGLQMRLTYRTARVLEGVSELGGRGSDPSNREIAEYAGIHDQGQVSKLLARLERLGLITNGGAGHLKGEPNAWALTSKGEQVTQGVRVYDISLRPGWAA